MSHIDPRVLAIYVAEKAGEEMHLVQEAHAIAGQGLSGDRYSTGHGSFNRNKQGERQVSFMNAIFFPGTGFAYRESRRNIITVGVELLWLIGREFTISGVKFRGLRYLDPCDRPSKLSGNPRSFKYAFFDRGSIIAEVLESGTIKQGDTVVSPPKGY